MAGSMVFSVAIMGALYHYGRNAPPIGSCRVGSCQSVVRCARRSVVVSGGWGESFGNRRAVRNGWNLPRQFVVVLEERPTQWVFPSDVR